MLHMLHQMNLTLTMDYFQLLMIIVITIFYLNNVEYGSEDVPSDSGSDELIINLIRLADKKKYNQTRKNYRIKIGLLFFDKCLNMQNVEFKRHFRISKYTYSWICECLLPILQNQQNDNNSNVGAPCISWDIKIAATMWYLATGETFRAVCERFGMGESTFFYALRNVIGAIIKKFSKEKIRYKSFVYSLHEWKR